MNLLDEVDKIKDVRTEHFTFLTKQDWLDNQNKKLVFYERRY